ncbi:MAG: hypothetical protein M3Y27_18205, partial [Acidobacteriota bacterium]|nr:hypothetical protein [Acidobacteriota bacterium]
TVAHVNGYEYIPIVIAESWMGDFESLKCAYYVYIQANPNQIQQITPELAERLTHLIRDSRILYRSSEN